MESLIPCYGGEVFKLFVHGVQKRRIILPFAYPLLRERRWVFDLGNANGTDWALWRKSWKWRVSER
jgi:hypothetical protein